MSNVSGAMTGRQITLPKYLCVLLNQLFEIERKTASLEEFDKIKRNIDRMNEVFRSEISQDIELYYEDPTGQAYDETRTDVEAHIAGKDTDDLIVVDVIKPIIRVKANQQSQLVQKGIVTVESRNAVKETNNG